MLDTAAYLLSILLNNGMFDKFIIFRNYVIPVKYKKIHGVLVKDVSVLSDCNLLSFYKLGLKEYLKEIDEFNDMYHCDCVKLMANFSNANYMKFKRCKDKVNDIVSMGNYCVFLTLTFDDSNLLNYLDPVELKMMKNYCTRYLKSISDNYMANVDFGGENNRFHFHALCHLKHSDILIYKDKRTLLNKNWSYGFMYTEVVNVDSNTDAVAKYIAKLTAHGVKVKEFRTNMISSRYINKNISGRTK